MTTQTNGQNHISHPLAARIRRARSRRSVRALVYGVDGVGKSSWGRDAPNPFFLCAEEDDMPDHVMSVAPADYRDAVSIVEALIKDPMDRQTFVIDTIDWFEPMIVRYVCERDDPRYQGKLFSPDGKPFLEGYGYGKGVDVVVDELRNFLGRLDKLRNAHDMNIVLLGHAGSHRKRNEGGDDYDIVEPKVQKKCADLYCEWPDVTLYAEFKKVVIAAAPDKVGAKAKVISQNERICWTQRRGAHRAKNRCGMPEQIPLSWAEFARYALADIPALRQQLDRKLNELGNEAVRDRVHAKIAEERGEAGVFLRAIEWVDKQLEKAAKKKTEQEEKEAGQ